MILDKSFKIIEGFSNYMINPIGEVYNLRTAKQLTLNDTWYNLKSDKSIWLKIPRRNLLLSNFPDIYLNKTIIRLNEKDIPKLIKRDSEKLQINIEKKNITLVF